MQKQGKSSPACESTSESSKTPCASASYSALCASAKVIKNEDGGSCSLSATDSTLTP